MKRKTINLLIAHNFGGVGKSTITACLLHPRLGGEILSVETNNTDAERYGVRLHRYAATQYPDYYEDLRRFAYSGNTITDVGASNIESFIDRLVKSGSRNRFDYVVVPATQTDRGQIETITTLRTLLDVVGIEPDRIRVVLNMVTKNQKRGPVEAEFPQLFAFADQDHFQKLNAILRPYSFEFAHADSYSVNTAPRESEAGNAPPSVRHEASGSSATVYFDVAPSTQARAHPAIHLSRFFVCVVSCKRALIMACGTQLSHAETDSTLLILDFKRKNWNGFVQPTRFRVSLLAGFHSTRIAQNQSSKNFSPFR